MNHLFQALKKELRKHAFDYLLFMTGGIFFLLALNLFKGERLLEFLILLSFVSFYIIWGMYHHIIENTVHLKTMLEYVFIGFLILFLIKFLIIP
ncbi:hypothetical protein A2966_02265 [Candidatus Roizmanbacteria bacterium RIFCSPLOWO2_01_FULL_41_22]|uniref:Uncharacterized protein n=2 Tax=Candidatus Roizmaniibacteriota TaxID=1752723 RepID=A0A1F7JRT4_9BACT|nr:MAG: hypothetical protein A2966_02265 [Candidatus Roizmanbacteria bacterium RIFCSPLOWO2_01_FULL_41_22]OGK58340.1 MAG: hypothetical protein A3H86_03215 [Candidatus Roizmanbacteria bacterium RIFCSPLOWO2_02_FULL_41_9]